jgi:hypothetical protein
MDLPGATGIGLDGKPDGFTPQFAVPKIDDVFGGTSSLLVPKARVGVIEHTRLNDHACKKIPICPTIARDSNIWACSAKTNLSHCGTSPPSPLPSLRPILIGLLPLDSAPVAIASTRSSQRNCASGNHVGSWKFVAFINAWLRLRLPKPRSHSPVPGLWTLIPDLGMSQRELFFFFLSFDPPTSPMR